MLTCADADGVLRPAVVELQILGAFALPDGVDDEDDVAHAGKSLGETLVGCLRLAVGRMPADADDAGAFLPAGLGEIQVARDEEAGATFEDHVFNPVGIAFDDAGDPGVQRRLFRPGAEAAVDPFLDGFHVSFGVGLGLQFGSDLVGRGLDPAHPLHEILLHHPGKAVQRLQFGLSGRGRGHGVADCQPVGRGEAERGEAGGLDGPATGLGGVAFAV